MITRRRDQTVSREPTVVSAEENLQAVKRAAGLFRIRSLNYPR